MPFETSGFHDTDKYPRIKDAIRGLVSRGHPHISGLSPEKQDEIAQHLASGQTSDKPEYTMNFWSGMARAGDPNYRADSILDPEERKQFEGFRQGFDDIRSTWPGPAWKQSQLKKFRKENGVLGSLWNHNQLSPGAQQSLQWSRPRHLFEGIQANMPGNDIGLSRVLDMYDRGKDAKHSSSWGSSNFEQNSGVADYVRSNGNPLGYINNNFFGPFQRSVYDTAMEHPQLQKKNAEEREDMGMSGQAQVYAEPLMYFIRPLAGLLSNDSKRRHDHQANAADVYMNGNQVFKSDPALPAIDHLRGMDAQNEIDRYRDVMAGAMESMPVQAYHHRNTGEFLSPGASLASTIFADAFTDPTVLFGGSFWRELGEELAYGGGFNAMQMMAGGFPSEDKVKDDSENWWKRANSSRREAEMIIRDNNIKGGVLSPLISPDR